MPEDSQPLSEVVKSLVRAVRSTVDVQRRVSAGLARPTELGPAYIRFMRKELLPYGRTIADLTIDYYRALTDAARDYGEAFYDEVLSDPDDDRPRDSAVAEPTEDRPRLDLHGESGAEVAASFSLENNDPDPAEVRLQGGVWRGPSGEAFTAPMTVEPASLTIAPGETATVTVRASLDPEHFTPGVEYRVPLHVSGPRPATVDVRLLAAPTDASEPGEPGFVVECPRCRRTFERTTDNVRLRPHKTPDGGDCPERKGRRTR